MIDDVPKTVLVLLAVALTLGRVWIAADRVSATALVLRRLWTPQTNRVVVAVFALIAFVVIAEDVVLEDVDEFILRTDHAVSASLSHGRRDARPIATTMSHLTGEGLALTVIVAVGVLLFKGYRADAVMITTNTLMAWMISGIAKVSFRVPRPRAGPVVDWRSSYGFPSGHVMVTLIALGMIAWAVGRRKPVGVRLSLYVIVGGLAIAAGTSRVVLGAHWPSDVFGGLTLGTAWLAIAIAGAESWHERHGRTNHRC